MKSPSFRLRIALLSALLAGTAVTSFGGIAYILLYRSNLQALDREIQEQLFREASTPKPDFHWQTFAESPIFTFGQSSELAAAFLILDNQEKVLYQSSNWQLELNPQALFPPQTITLDVDNSAFPPRPQPPPVNQRGQQLSREKILELTKLSNPITRKTPRGDWRLATVSSPFVRVAIAVNLQVINQEMASIRTIFLLLIPVTLLLVTLGAWLLSDDALKSVQNITNVIRKVTAKGLNQRISTEGLDIEFVELVQVFNQMLERLERSFQQASRFSADAAHELKTPLAILQGELERAVQQAEIASKEQQIFSNLLDEVRRLSSITRKLLLLSLADAGKMQIQKNPINLSEILHNLAEDIDLIAPELTLETKILPDLMIQGDQELITQVLQNLITNAIKYNLPNGWIHLETEQQNQTVLIKVSNASSGIAAGDRQRIFERFHRGDASHNRKVEGFGLGLSLSREIARAHGGNLTIDPTPAHCTAFTLSLPIKTFHPKKS